MSVQATTALSVAMSTLRFEPDQVIGTRVGLRPFRATGFRVSSERLGNTVLVHHYGHGGCGITLSWGTAHEAAALVRATGHRQAAVIGAGAVGLATARVLQSQGIDVTVYAAAFGEATTSGVAGAFWSPFALVDPEGQTPAFAQRLGRALRIAHRMFRSVCGVYAGVRTLPLYTLVDDAPDHAWEAATAPELFVRSPAPAGTHPFGQRAAERTESFAIDPVPYLAALLADVQHCGGHIVQRTFADIDEVARLPHPVIVNCTGLGARTLFGDDTLVPIHGQLLLLAPQPGIPGAAAAPAQGLYLLPQRGALVAGTTQERGRWTLAPDADESARLLSAHGALFGTPIP